MNFGEAVSKVMRRPFFIFEGFGVDIFDQGKNGTGL